MNQLDYALEDAVALVEDLEIRDWEVDPVDLAIALAREDVRDVICGLEFYTAELNVISAAARLAGYDCVGESCPHPHMSYIVRFEKRP